MGNPGYADEYYLDSPSWSGSTLVPVTAGSETSDIDFTLEPGGTISGRIVDLDGNPVYGVSVLLESPYVLGLGFVIEASEAYSFSGLPYGTYTMTCPSGFWGPADGDWQQQVVTVVLGPDTPDVVYDFVLAPAAADSGFISGTVTGPDGLPLGGIYIQAQAEPWSPDGYSSGWTDADGHYRLSALAAGNYRVYAKFNPGYAEEYYLDSHSWSGSTLVPVTVGEETAGIDFTLEPGGTISGRIVDLDGNPVYGVSVLLENPDILGIVIEASEAYSFSGLPYGTYTMTCPSGFWGPADGDWQQQVVTVVLGPDIPDVVYDFVLAPPAVVVSGTVKFTPTVLNLNSSADLCARIELEPGYSAADIDLSTIRLESDLGVVAAERAEVRGGLLWVWFDHDTIAPILSVSDDLTLTVTGSIGSADLEAVGHLRVVAPRKSK
jgi:hypothetical protein